MKSIRQDLFLPISIIAASLILGASLIFAAKIIAVRLSGKEQSGSTRKMLDELVRTINEQNTARPAAAGKRADSAGNKRVAGVIAGTNRIMGDSRAPVLMVEFSDLQCPFTRSFYRQTFPLIEKEYISTGKIKFAFRDFPLEFHSSAMPAAIAVKCAGKQGKYWKMFDKLMLSPSLDEESLKKCAREAGLNMKSYEKFRNSNDIGREIENDIKDARRFGVRGTPAFFINGRFVSGARSFAVFKKIIDEELAGSAGEK